VNGKVRQEFIATLGNLKVLWESGALDRFIAQLARHPERRWIEAEALSLVGRWSREYGVVSVFWRLWEKLGLHQLFQEWYLRSPLELPLGEAIFRDGAKSAGGARQYPT